MIRFRSKVSYDGTSFLGWQTQRSVQKRTVQGTLEEAIGLVFNVTLPYTDHESNSTISIPAAVVVGAGRTDTGVHALEQHVHFSVPSSRLVAATMLNNVSAVASSINAVLPPDIVLYDLSFAPTSRWHSILTSKSKIYTYRFVLGPGTVLDPLLRRTRSHVYYDVSLPLLKKVLALFKGEHDFEAFACGVEANLRKRTLNYVPSSSSSPPALAAFPPPPPPFPPPSFVRVVHSIKLAKEGPSSYRIDVHLSGALYKMVRNIVGFAFGVCRRRTSSSRDQDGMRTPIPPEDNDSESEDEARRFLEVRSLLRRLMNEEEEGDDRRRQEQGGKRTRNDNPYKPVPPNGLRLERVFYRTD